jgi:hypothetical protein
MLLGQLLQVDTGYRGARVPCGRGHQATFSDYRAKTLHTVLGPLRIRRAYYHCPACREGVIPRDGELDITATSFSPGVRRLMSRLGGKEPFEEARGDLDTLAGITAQTKQVERVSEAIGEQIEALSGKERKAALAGKVVLLHPVPRMYVAIDGTGVPMVPRETQDRPGKDGIGPAKTREAKLGCVFAQTGLDEKGWPVRDEGSTTYVGDIESAEDFGRRIFTEGIRRGSRRAEQIIVLGDGAPGPGASPTSTSRAPSRSLTSITPANTSANSPRSAMALAHPSQRLGRPPCRRPRRRRRGEAHLHHDPPAPRHLRSA